VDPKKDKSRYNRPHGPKCIKRIEPRRPEDAWKKKRKDVGKQEKKAEV
jgi:hypothetical protein